MKQVLRAGIIYSKSLLLRSTGPCCSDHLSTALYYVESQSQLTWPFFARSSGSEFIWSAAVGYIRAIKSNIWRKKQGAYRWNINHLLHPSFSRLPWLRTFASNLKPGVCGRPTRLLSSAFDRAFWQGIPEMLKFKQWKTHCFCVVLHLLCQNMTLQERASQWTENCGLTDTHGCLIRAYFWCFYWSGA